VNQIAPGAAQAEAPKAIAPLGDFIRDELASLSPLNTNSEASQPANERASEAESESKKGSTHALPTFHSLIAPLEQAGDEHGPKRLNGWGLDVCLAAFAEYPDGFAACVARVYEKWTAGESDRPLGLLCRMVQQGEHAISLDEGGRP
jgi:hypothetical protein